MTQATKGAVAPRKTKPLPFYSYNAEKMPLFSINENVPFEDVLDHAHCFMISAEDSMLKAAEEADTPSAWGAYYLAQVATALIESMTASLAKENRNV